MRLCVHGTDSMRAGEHGGQDSGWRRSQRIVTERRKHIERARVVLASIGGGPVQQIAAQIGISRPMVWRWQQRFAEEGVDGLLRDKTRKPGKPPIPAETVARVVALTCADPPHEATHWTGRAMAKAAGISLRSVQRIWEAHQLQPHRVRTFKRSRDPQFADKLVDIVGLYLDPPAHAVVLSIDEKSQIQALDRTQPGLPLKPGRCGTMTHDYKRHGTTTLFAALNVLDGSRDRALHAATPARGVHPLPQCRRARCSGRQADRGSGRQLRHPQAPKVTGWLARHPRWTFHFTPTSGSWLNAVENFFSAPDTQAHPARQLPVDRRPAGSHQPLPRRTQCRAQALHLESLGRLDPGQARQTAAPSV